MNMKKIKNINWFWKNWTESEKKIYKKCAVFAAIVIMLEIMLAIACMNQFHAYEPEPPEYGNEDLEIPAEWGICPPGWHHETRWDDEKGEWHSVYVPDSYKPDLYEVDANGALYIFQRMFNMIYSSLLPLASVLACTLVGYNYCLIMTSKNQRKIDESYTHIKVVAKTWIYIMLTSVFITLAVQGFSTAVNSEFANPIIHP